MIIASCRRNFDSTRILSKRTQYRDFPDPSQPDAGKKIELADLKAQARDQHVCVMVHGFNNTLPAILKAYGELQAGLARAGLSGPKGYGLVVGFAWPGWTSGLGYIPAIRSANHSGPQLRQLVNDLRSVALSVDIQTHSLGARVALRALAGPEPVFVDNLLLSAPAVDHDVLEPRQPFHRALATCNRCLVYHSRHDSVLRGIYRLGDIPGLMKKSLGMGGPRDKKTTLEKCPNVYVVDCAACVATHSGYRKATPYLAHWRRVWSGAPLPRYEAL